MKYLQYTALVLSLALKVHAGGPYEMWIHEPAHSKQEMQEAIGASFDIMTKNMNLNMDKDKEWDGKPLPISKHALQSKGFTVKASDSLEEMRAFLKQYSADLQASQKGANYIVVGFFVEYMDEKKQFLKKRPPIFISDTVEKLPVFLAEGSSLLSDAKPIEIQASSAACKSVDTSSPESAGLSHEKASQSEKQSGPNSDPSGEDTTKSEAMLADREQVEQQHLRAKKRRQIRQRRMRR